MKHIRKRIYNKNYQSIQALKILYYNYGHYIKVKEKNIKKIIMNIVECFY